MRRTDLLCWAVILLAGAVSLYLWHLNPEFRVKNVGEPFANANQFIVGKNFKDFGFLNSRFLPDYAVGDKEYHPLYGTHNPPLAEMINGLYQMAGLTRIEWQRLVCIVWALLSFWFFYATIKSFLNASVALWSLVIAATNPFVLYMVDDLYFGLEWLFVYASFYFLFRYLKDKRRIFVSLSWFCFFCISFSEYEFIPLMVMFVVGLKLLKLKKVSYRLLCLLLSAPAAAIAVHQSLAISTIGFDLWYRDMLEIFLHRTLGVRTSFLEIYRASPLLLYDIEAILPRGYPRLLYARLEGLYGYGWSLLSAGLLFGLIRRRVLPDGLQARSSRLLLLFFAMGAVWYVLFPQHTFVHFHSYTMLLFLPFTSLLWGSVVSNVWQRAMRVRVKIACFALILFALGAARVHHFVYPQPFPGIDQLRKYKGVSFCTNVIPTLVEYYTQTPAAFCGYWEEFHALKEGRYHYFLRQDKRPLPTPELFFSVDSDFDQELTSNFPVLEQGPGYIIFKLPKKAAAGG